MDKDFQITFGNQFKNKPHAIYFKFENEYSSVKSGFCQSVIVALKIS